MPEHHLLDLDSLPSAFEPCPECGDVMCQPDPWGEDCDDRARRRQAVATLEDQRRQAHALAAPAAARAPATSAWPAATSRTPTWSRPWRRPSG